MRSMTRLFPIHRHLMGDGVRETIKILREYVPFEVYEIPTGTNAFDWEVPKEWKPKSWALSRHRGGDDNEIIVDNNTGGPLSIDGRGYWL